MTKELNEIANKVIEKMQSLNNSDFREECPISIINMTDWEWAQGVGLYGLYKFFKLNNDEGILNYLESWFLDNIKKGLPPVNINTTAPMLTLAYLCEENIKSKDIFLKIVEKWAEDIIETMPRTQENGFQHLITGPAEITREQLWDDTLFMLVLFLAKAGKMLNRKDFIDESVRQFLVHIKYLVDRKTGLLYHVWTFEGRHHFANALWARGNCWYTAGVVDYLEIFSDIDMGVKNYLIDTLVSQVETLATLQSDSGMWHTLLNDETSYLETSATAGFAYGILKGVRMGYLEEKFKIIGQKAKEAVMKNINKDGIVENVSYGTGVGHNLEFYKVVPICPMTYGQALTLLMLTE